MRVGVFGALGKMGRTVCETVAGDAALELVAGIDPAGPGEVAGVPVSQDATALLDAGAEVAVDFTHADAAAGNIAFCLDNGIHCVVGTTGIPAATLDELGKRAEAGDANVFIAPNFSIGAVLATHFAKQAARYLGSCEVIELHHNQKLDAPSGTALRTAGEIAEVWEKQGRPPGGEPAEGEHETLERVRGGQVGGVGVHAVRLHGLVAHQEILFGGLGQLLTIRHDSLDRSSFMPGVLLAVKAVATRPGITVGLEQLLEL